MSNISLNREACKKIREQLQELIDTHGPEVFGKATIHVGNATFNPCSVTFKVEVTPGGEEAKADKDREDFELYAYRYNLKPEDYGAAFKDNNGRDFTLCGFVPRKSKRPVLAKTADGKVYQFPIESVLWLLGRHDEAKKRRDFMRGL